MRSDGVPLRIPLFLVPLRTPSFFVANRAGICYSYIARVIDASRQFICTFLSINKTGTTFLVKCAFTSVGFAVCKAFFDGVFYESIGFIQRRSGQLGLSRTRRPVRGDLELL